ncbi:DMT family transporter [Pseudotabrizicola alkalilacus]|uniref:DMT family transporter n=1 Tax=Pseudotabrizicola alkalilacus TaxID=2305252 RepID=A0A411YWX3_9RHOB|nr:DMT family transporter [Pseudotabrizicola alkalilacus]RGP35233.1 DMT family transporter [Pseudotabrizicola alkalilacus]
MSQIPALLTILVGGIAIAVQAPLNGALGRTLGAALPAAAVSFAVGFIALMVLSFATVGNPFGRLGAVPLWQWAGGLLGAYYVWSVIWGVPTLGVVTAMAALILGQMAGALMLDAVGAFGVPVQPISLTRILAVVMVAGGLVLSRL